MTSKRLSRAPLLFALLMLLGASALQTGTAQVEATLDLPAVATATPVREPTSAVSAGLPAPPQSPESGSAGPTAKQGIQTEPAAPWTYPGGGPTNEFTFRCEQPTAEGVFSVTNQDVVVYGCPIRIYDATYHFGSPDLAVNPKDSREAAFFTLHSTPEKDGSTDQSRQGSSHTAFTTATRGVSWSDQPVQSGPTGRSLGDYSAGTMDSQGNMYIAYGWHDPVGADVWDGSIGLFKAGTTRDRGTVFLAYEDPYYILAREIGNPIRSLDINFVPDPASDEEQQFADANETQAPSDEDDFGEEAITINRTDQVVVSWHEKAYDWRNASTGLSGWIDFSWSSTNASQDWERLPTDEVIGPCFDASNAVTWKGQVYVACVVDKGYKERSRARIGDVDIWKFDPATAKTSYVASTGLNGPNPRLTIAADGAMALTTSKVEDPQQVVVDVAFGWYGRQWNPFGANLGPALHGYAGGRDIRSAHVTGVALTEDQHTLYLVYKEWNEPRNTGPLPDPSELNGDPPRLHDYRKVMVALNACEILVAAAMELGQGVDAGSYGAYMEHPALFNDIRDGLEYVREPNGEELVYFAVNDYGAMQFGAIVEGAVGRPCANFPVPIPTIPLPPVPAALGTGLPANYAVGAVLGVASLSMVGYLLAAKRRSPTWVAAEDR